MSSFNTVIVETDLLICGGGMAACGAAVEAAYWAKQQGLKVTLVDKAAMDRSGAVAMGLSAINLYLDHNSGDNTLRDYVDYVRNDLMGITREDLVANIARHVDGTVHMFEKWGLPIWKNEQGRYVHEGRWQVMINGESYKVIVAEAAKKALAEAGGEYFERVFITHPLMAGDRCVGAIGFSTRQQTIYVFKAKAVLTAMGGAVHIFRPRSTGEGLGRSWYPPFNSAGSASFTIQAGAEMTCQEVRFVPVRFKDAYGPVGAWFLLFKAIATNALGEDYMKTNEAELDKWGPYGRAKPTPANLRNWLMMIDVIKGKGPILMRTDEAIKRISEQMGDPKAAQRKLKELDSEAWEDFLDMTIAQALLWASSNVEPDKTPSEIMACEPYFIGSHSGASGAWVSGPEDLQTDATRSDYFWGYANMTTVPGLFAAGDASGASSHKFSSGSFTEGRLAGKAAIAFIADHPAASPVPDARIAELTAQILKPLETFEAHRNETTDADINPKYVRPKQLMNRLQKIMDEYAGGVSCQLSTSEHQLVRGLELLDLLRKDSANLAAESLHELMRCWENVHRLYQAEAHVRSVLFREETRWPGYYFRADKPTIDQQNWLAFCNCKYDQATGQWTMIKRPVKYLTNNADA
jgi:adenylylsulfate reductase, subunit A